MIDKNFILNLLGVLDDMKEVATHAKNSYNYSDMAYALDYVIMKIEMIEHALRKKL